ncbi:heterokaryon incompatibility protein-domain-containing protein [Xylariales sp. PMI_506]|nr:heterokaryon incompatibility protein-domain-containing protein [Xylariales sp. PMI_506]
MRLLEATTLALVNFTDPVPVQYAILSHTWEQDEVTFQDIGDLELARTRCGFAKIAAACRETLSNGLHYLWVDTCCIDKTSSAELTEAINSMFAWYQGAKICFAYLSDLPPCTYSQDAFAQCRWFSRGWTLQELIAPRDLRFYGSQWDYIGDKSELRDWLFDLTKIEYSVLRGWTPLHEVSIARRMSWAARRETTRVEDMAYCLLGIFDVNMPMLYGEGQKAFFRLQEELLRRSTELSLFAWQAVDGDNQAYRGILAHSPAEFVNCGDVELNSDQFQFSGEFSVTNRGLKITTRLRRMEKSGAPRIMSLDCYHTSNPDQVLGIYLRKALRIFVRQSPEYLAEFSRDLPVDKAATIYLGTRMDTKDSEKLEFDKFPSFKFNLILSDGFSMTDVHAEPADLWDVSDPMFLTDSVHYFLGFVRFRLHHTHLALLEHSLLLICGFGFNGWGPWCSIHCSRSNDDTDLFAFMYDYQELASSCSLQQISETIRDRRQSSVSVESKCSKDSVIVSIATWAYSYINARVDINARPGSKDTEAPPQGWEVGIPRFGIANRQLNLTGSE